MFFTEILSNSPLILSECAVSERLGRMQGIELHPTLFNSPLIYNKAGRMALTKVYTEYREIASSAALPIMLCAPTWRADRFRIAEANIPLSLVRDTIGFFNELKENWYNPNSPVITGALIGPAYDCYDGSLAPKRKEAAEYHQWQIHEMATQNIDVIIAQTIPAVREALGMADVLATLDTPYILSFVINRHCQLPDNTMLGDAIQMIDQEIDVPPVGYMVNCVYPTFLRAEKHPSRIFPRLIGIQANSSSLDHSQLDNATSLLRDPLDDWGKQMLLLNREWGVKILGGCCGTDDNYLRYLVEPPTSL